MGLLLIIGLLLVILIVGEGGSVTIYWAVAVQPLSSSIVTVYVPWDKPVAFVPVCNGVEFQL